MERTIHFLELAGWGGGPGFYEAVPFEGPMRVFADASCPCLLSVTAMGPVKTKGWVAENMGGEVKEHFDPDRGRKVRDGVLPKGKHFQVHSSHVRMMG